MTLTIDLPPALEERLQEESAWEGLPAVEFARRVLEERLLPSGNDLASGKVVKEQRLRAFNEWVGSRTGYHAPPLSDEAVSRDSIYREREAEQL